MKPAIALGSLASLLVPALAQACPGAACGSCGGTHLSGYVSALAIGVLAGMGGTSLHDAWRARRDRRE